MLKIHKITKGYEDKHQFHYGGQAYVTGAVPGIVAKEVKILDLYVLGEIDAIYLREFV